jgi:hypothetical protein
MPMTSPNKFIFKRIIQRKKLLIFVTAILFSATANYSLHTLYADSHLPPPGQHPGGGIIPSGEFPPDGKMPPDGKPGMHDLIPVTFSAIYEQKGGNESKSNASFTAANQDQSGIYLFGKGKLTLSDITINKTGITSSEDGSNFYGLNAGILASESSILTMSNSSITTSGDGANAVFSCGKGSSITLSKTIIRTVKNSSRGLDATMGGSITGADLDIETKGEHCAAAATDRGEGTINIIRGQMKTFGVGSPGIYSTGNISATDAVFTAIGSEAAIIEGKNSITLTDTAISGRKKCGVMMYQSFSGDAGVGTSIFKMTRGTLTSKEGPLFFITNTHAKIFLKEVKLSPASGVLIMARSDRWGKNGSNGGHLEFNADAQILNGDINADRISSISLTLKNGSTLSGAVSNASIALDDTSTWIVRKNSHINGLSINSDMNHDQFAQIIDNGHTIFYNSTLPENNWLEGNEFKLQGGGKLTPEK